MSFDEAVRLEAGERDPIEVFEAMPPYEAAAVEMWIALSIVPAISIKPDCNSEDLRFDAEDELGFCVPNDVFKGAMLAAGYCPVSRRAPDWEFGIKRRCGRCTGGYSGYKLDRERLDPDEVELFDAVRALASRQGRSGSLEQLCLDPGPIYRLRDLSRLIQDSDWKVFERAGNLGLIPDPVLRRVFLAVVEGLLFVKDNQNRLLR